MLSSFFRTSQEKVLSLNTEEILALSTFDSVCHNAKFDEHVVASGIGDQV